MNILRKYFLLVTFFLVLSSDLLAQGFGLPTKKFGLGLSATDTSNLQLVIASRL